MIVISDSSALSALAETDLLWLLPRLFGAVVIPEDVACECTQTRAPRALRDWIGDPPDWLQIVPNPVISLPETEGLGAGEAAAIALTWENRSAAKLILDEKRGRRVAEALGLPKTGVLGIIGEAAGRRWLEFDETVERIIQTGFHVRRSVIDAVRDRLES